MLPAVRNLFSKRRQRRQRVHIPTTPSAANSGAKMSGLKKSPPLELNKSKKPTTRQSSDQCDCRCLVLPCSAPAEDFLVTTMVRKLSAMAGRRYSLSVDAAAVQDLKILPYPSWLPYVQYLAPARHSNVRQARAEHCPRK